MKLNHIKWNRLKMFYVVTKRKIPLNGIGKSLTQIFFISIFDLHQYSNLTHLIVYHYNGDYRKNWVNRRKKFFFNRIVII